MYILIIEVFGSFMYLLHLMIALNPNYEFHVLKSIRCNGVQRVMAINDEKPEKECITQHN